ncbi:hypothetical protein AHF37_01956 [Paragonimus kellicotti]|nr:hypothetical protein AHF37_01956 [Paragonimus kellicotti]
MIRIWDEMVNLIVYALLLLLVQPKNANMVFPFHVQQAKSTSHETVIEPEPSPKPTKTQTPRPGTPIRAVHETAEAAKFKVKDIEQQKISKPASPTRPPIKLPAIGGKPGDLPPPGFSVTRNLAHLSTEAQLQKRPQTTPSMPTVQSRNTIRAVHETAEAAKFKVKDIEQQKISKPASPTRPPIKLPAIGGKPGDLPPPGFSVTRNLAHLSTEAQLQKRPQTTPSMPTVQSRSDPKFSSTA